MRRESHAPVLREVKSLRPTHPTVPVLAKGETDTGQCWIYVRDDRPRGDGPAGSDVLILIARQSVWEARDNQDGGVAAIEMVSVV